MSTWFFAHLEAHFGSPEPRFATTNTAGWQQQPTQQGCTAGGTATTYTAAHSQWVPVTPGVQKTPLPASTGEGWGPGGGQGQVQEG